MAEEGFTILQQEEGISNNDPGYNVPPEFRDSWDNYLRKCDSNSKETTGTLKKVSNVYFKAVEHTLDQIVRESAADPSMREEIQRIKAEMISRPYDGQEHTFSCCGVTPDSLEGLFIGIKLRKHVYKDLELCSYVLLWHNFKKNKQWWRKRMGKAAIAIGAVSGGAIIGATIVPPVMVALGAIGGAAIGAAAHYIYEKRISTKSAGCDEESQDDPDSGM